MKKYKYIITVSMMTIIMMTIPQDIYSATNDKEMVILLHGLGRSANAMKKMADHLEIAGYETINVDYPSTSKSIQDIAQQDVAKAVDICRQKNAAKIHFVTHSLGGIVLRQYLQYETLPKGSRAVMLSPPNKGSELAENLKDFRLFKWALGPAGQALGTDDKSIPNSLAPIKIEIGIITGDQRMTPDFMGIMQGPNDGKVSVARSKLDEMSDFMIVPATHTFIMRHPVVLEEVVYFLKNGQFQYYQSRNG